MREVIVIKIGGSVVLDKRDRLKTKLVKELFKVFSISSTRKIIVVGCGSSLHSLTYHYNLIDKPEVKYKHVARMGMRIRGFFELYKLVEDNLLSIVKSIPSKSGRPDALPPAWLFIKNSKGSTKTHEVVWFNRKLLEKSRYPLTSGGVVLDKNVLVSAISSDTIAAYLATTCGAKRMFLLTDVDGVYTEFPGGKLLEKVHLDAIKNYKIEGGMKDKLRRIKLAIDKKIPTFLINGNYPQRIKEALIKGETEICSEILK